MVISLIAQKADSEAAEQCSGLKPESTDGKGQRPAQVVTIKFKRMLKPSSSGSSVPELELEASETRIS